MNRLAEYLKLYDKEMGPVPTSRVDSSNMTAGANAQLNAIEGSNERGRRLTGALALMDQMEPQGGMQETPNFFAETQRQAAPAYIQPEPVSRIPQREFVRPQRQDTRNMMAQILQRGGGRGGY